jgi:GTPase SAR1 family protein
MYIHSLFVHDQCSFEHILSWNREIEDANSTSNKKILKLLVGNKTDLVQRREVPTDQGESCAKRLSASFVETSACSSTNVDVAFLNLARRLVKQQ